MLGSSTPSTYGTVDIPCVFADCDLAFTVKVDLGLAVGEGGWTITVNPDLDEYSLHMFEHGASVSTMVEET